MQKTVEEQTLQISPVWKRPQSPVTGITLNSCSEECGVTCCTCSRATGVAWVNVSRWIPFPGSSRIRQPMSNHLTREHEQGCSVSPFMRKGSTTLSRSVYRTQHEALPSTYALLTKSLIINNKLRDDVRDEVCSDDNRISVTTPLTDCFSDGNAAHSLSVCKLSQFEWLFCFSCY